MPPEPSRIWLVRQGDPTATEGILSLEGSELTFASTTGSQRFRWPVDRLRRVRRRRGTPVLTCVSVAPPAEREERLFFYFAQPPPLPGERSGSAAPTLLAPRGLERSAAALTLRQANRMLKEKIEGWVRALRAAGAAP